VSSGKKPKWTLDMSLVVKLASIVVHADEMTSPLGHGYDKVALRQLVEDPEVSGWVKSLGPLAPVKR